MSEEQTFMVALLFCLGGLFCFVYVVVSMVGQS